MHWAQGNESFASAVLKNLEKGGMAVERWRDPDLQAFVGAGDTVGNPGQVAFHVDAQRQEIGYDDEAADSQTHQTGGCGWEVGLPEFQEGGFHVAGRTGARQGGGGGAHGVIGRFDAGTVSENDDAGGGHNFYRLPSIIIVSFIIR